MSDADLKHHLRLVTNLLTYFCRNTKFQRVCWENRYFAIVVKLHLPLQFTKYSDNCIDGYFSSTNVQSVPKKLCPVCVAAVEEL